MSFVALLNVSGSDVIDENGGADLVEGFFALQPAVGGVVGLPLVIDTFLQEEDGDGIPTGFNGTF